uniref:Pseudouridine synthase RsuA/RluA-like domain-containing protein n=1 Tax=Chromera velia CCMP2878 TaxID=1169474 RepID=A0A0G4I2C6_9ALVE|eukprot:Cvel_10359.t1-p1 / transcript=Cvel_10359.t1 / gene=Cvel_10359 / organism=Chromera_velia_CCMP2878 / gene_product=MATH and LRR domain-containing protein PFE0570w, putative / transcript_product=MATH and LRR domain-containing protein PFE0570w, putative / location=Cvel_scaffold623:1071-9198(-) / protein_length=2083 / sequence_SO=supercontig / SO=protein_coding / is_pseudo=false
MWGDSRDVIGYSSASPSHHHLHHQSSAASSSHGAGAVASVDERNGHAHARLHSRHAAAMPHENLNPHWPSVTSLAAGRPVEAAGVGAVKTASALQEGHVQSHGSTHSASLHSQLLNAGVPVHNTHTSGTTATRVDPGHPLATFFNRPPTAAATAAVTAPGVTSRSSSSASHLYASTTPQVSSSTQYQSQTAAQTYAASSAHYLRDPNPAVYTAAYRSPSPPAVPVDAHAHVQAHGYGGHSGGHSYQAASPLSVYTRTGDNATVVSAAGMGAQGGGRGSSSIYSDLKPSDFKKDVVPLDCSDSEAEEEEERDPDHEEIMDTLRASPQSDERGGRGRGRDGYEDDFPDELLSVEADSETRERGLGLPPSDSEGGGSGDRRPSLPSFPPLPLTQQQPQEQPTRTFVGMDLRTFVNGSSNQQVLRGSPEPSRSDASGGQYAANLSNASVSGVDPSSKAARGAASSSQVTPPTRPSYPGSSVALQQQGGGFGGGGGENGAGRSVTDPSGGPSDDAGRVLLQLLKGKGGTNGNSAMEKAVPRSQTDSLAAALGGGGNSTATGGAVEDMDWGRGPDFHPDSVEATAAAFANFTLKPRKKPLTGAPGAPPPAAVVMAGAPAAASSAAGATGATTSGSLPSRFPWLDAFRPSPSPPASASPSPISDSPCPSPYPVLRETDKLSGSPVPALSSHRAGGRDHGAVVGVRSSTQPSEGSAAYLVPLSKDPSQKGAVGETDKSFWDRFTGKGGAGADTSTEDRLNLLFSSPARGPEGEKRAGYGNGKAGGMGGGSDDLDGFDREFEDEEREADEAGAVEDATAFLQSLLSDMVKGGRGAKGEGSSSREGEAGGGTSSLERGFGATGGWSKRAAEMEAEKQREKGGGEAPSAFDLLASFNNDRIDLGASSSSSSATAAVSADTTSQQNNAGAHLLNLIKGGKGQGPASEQLGGGGDAGAGIDAQKKGQRRGEIEKEIVSGGEEVSAAIALHRVLNPQQQQQTKTSTASETAAPSSSSSSSAIQVPTADGGGEVLDGGKGLLALLRGGGGEGGGSTRTGISSVPIHHSHSFPSAAVPDGVAVYANAKGDGESETGGRGSGNGAVVGADGYHFVELTECVRLFEKDSGNGLKAIVNPAAMGSHPRVVYRSRGLAVIMKPPGWLVDELTTREMRVRLEELAMLKSGQRRAAAEMQGLKAFVRKELGWENTKFVHRLDFMTSGPVLLGTNPQSYQKLSRQFERRLVCKEYICLVHGEVRQAFGVIDAAIETVKAGASAKTTGSRSRVVMEGGVQVDDKEKDGGVRTSRDRGRGGSKGGDREREKEQAAAAAAAASTEQSLGKKRAITSFSVVATYAHPKEHADELGLEGRARRSMLQARYTLVRVRIATGRTHQIRCHLEHLGHPLVADSKYAGPEVAALDSDWCPRMFLHARKLRFVDLESRVIDIRAPLPPDLWEALCCLKLVHRRTTLQEPFPLASCRCKAVFFDSEHKTLVHSGEPLVCPDSVQQEETRFARSGGGGGVFALAWEPGPGRVKRERRMQSVGGFGSNSGGVTQSAAAGGFGTNAAVASAAAAGGGFGSNVSAAPAASRGFGSNLAGDRDGVVSLSLENCRKEKEKRKEEKEATRNGGAELLARLNSKQGEEEEGEAEGTPKEKDREETEENADKTGKAGESGGEEEKESEGKKEEKEKERKGGEEESDSLTPSLKEKEGEKEKGEAAYVDSPQQKETEREEEGAESLPPPLSSIPDNATDQDSKADVEKEKEKEEQEDRFGESKEHPAASSSPICSPPHGPSDPSVDEEEEEEDLPMQKRRSAPLFEEGAEEEKEDAEGGKEIAAGGGEAQGSCEGAAGERKLEERKEETEEQRNGMKDEEVMSADSPAAKLLSLLHQGGSRPQFQREQRQQPPVSLLETEDEKGGDTSGDAVTKGKERVEEGQQKEKSADAFFDDFGRGKAKTFSRNNTSNPILDILSASACSSKHPNSQIAETGKKTPPLSTAATAEEKEIEREKEEDTNDTAGTKPAVESVSLWLPKQPRGSPQPSSSKLSAPSAVSRDSVPALSSSVFRTVLCKHCDMYEARSEIAEDGDEIFNEVEVEGEDDS